MKKLLLVLASIILVVVCVVKFSGITLNKITVGNKALVLGNNDFEEKYLNKHLPPFHLKDMEGNSIDSKKLQGKFVHINFWSVYCIPCIKEFADLNKLKSTYQKNVIFIAITPESIEKVKKTIINNPFNYVIIPNGETYFNELGIKSYPKNFFVDKKGIIRNVAEGSQSKVSISEASVNSANFSKYSDILTALK